ncbi:hypothetical protein [Catenulispora rubra]|uniref:hypothetical protein n=1 Tax=Catenulispora rubra TaxID=280293 RepID=UPI0018920A55|nr:hypothetical protein [Catenulispora rubra]
MTLDRSALAGSDAPVPFDPDMLTAIRRRLNEICDAAQEPAPAAGNPFAAVRDHSEPAELAKTLAAWGARAEPAVPELVRLLAVRPIAAAPALAAIGQPTLACVAALQRVAGTADGAEAVHARLAAARAVRSLTGGTEALLVAVQFGLTTPSKDPDDRAAAADAAAELPDPDGHADRADHADLLTPLLLQALQAIPVPTPSLPAHQARLKLGRALWLFTGRPEYVIEVLRSTLDLAGGDFTAWTVATAAELAADLAPDLGPAARELIPGLEAALADPVSAGAAARALKSPYFRK